MSLIPISKLLATGVGYCLTNKDLLPILGLAAPVTPIVQVAAGLAQAILPEMMGGFNDEIDYQKFRKTLFEEHPDKINHDLSNLLKDAAVRSVGFVKKLYLEKITKEQEITIWSKINDKPFKVEKARLKDMQSDVAFLMKDKNIETLLLEQPENCLDDITNYLFEVSALNQNQEKWIAFRAFFKEKLPFCFDLAFKEALKENQKGRIAFQIWIWQDIQKDVKTTKANTEAILKEVQSLKLALENNAPEPANSLQFQKQITKSFEELNGKFEAFCVEIIGKLDELISKLDTIEKKQDESNKRITKSINKLQETIQLKVLNEKTLLKQLQIVHDLLNREKLEKENQRIDFLKKEDEYYNSIEELKNRYNNLLLEIAKTNKPEDLIQKSELLEQIVENEKAQKKIQELNSQNELEIKSIEAKYSVRIDELLGQIKNLEIELKIQKDSISELKAISIKASQEIQNLIVNNDFDSIIEYPVNNPLYTLKDTASIFLIKANVFSSLFRIQEAEESYKKSISAFEYEENLFAYSKFLYNKKDWENCLKFSKKALDTNINLDSKLILLNQILKIYLIDNKNTEGIEVCNKFINDYDIDKCSKIEIATFYINQGSHYTDNLDIDEARECFKKVIHIIDAINNENYLFLKIDALLLLGNTFFDYKTIVKFDEANEANEKAINYFEEANATLKLIKDKNSIYFKLTSLKIEQRLGSLLKNDIDGRGIKHLNLAYKFGEILFSNNDLNLEYIYCNLDLYYYHTQKNNTDSSYYYSQFISLKNIIETRNDLQNKQDKFYINTWLFAEKQIRANSSLTDFYIQESLASFEECASHSNNEFIYNGITFLRAVAAYYQTFDVEKSIIFYKKLISWLKTLEESKPSAFTELLCSSFFNLANTFVRLGDDEEALLNYEEAQKYIDEKLLSPFKYFFLKIEIASGIASIDLNNQNFEKAIAQLDTIYNSINTYEFDDLLEDSMDMNHLLNNFAKQYSFCNVPKKALDIHKMVLYKTDIILKNGEKYQYSYKQSIFLLFTYVDALFESGKIYIVENDIERGKSYLIESLNIRAKFLEEHPVSTNLLMPTYCQKGLEIAQILMKIRDTDYKDILIDVLKLSEKYKDEEGHEWAEKIFHEASMLVMVQSQLGFSEDFTDTPDLGDSFNHEQLVLGFSSLLTVAAFDIRDKKYNEAIKTLKEGIYMFDKSLTPKGKLSEYQYYFQMIFVLSSTYLKLNKIQEAELTIQNAYHFSKEILQVKENEEKQFVMVCEHYSIVLEKAFESSNFFTRGKVRSRIKQIYQDMKQTVENYTFNDNEEIRIFKEVMEKMFKLI